MSKKLQVFRKVSLLLGIVTLMLGLLPLASFSGGVIFADDSPPAPENSGEEKNQEADPPANPPENNESSDQEEEAEELEEELLLEESEEFEMSLMSVIGDDPDVGNELPDFGNTYTNGDCVTNTSCEPDEPVTNPNDYTNTSGYGYKDYVLPLIDGQPAKIVAIKDGNTWLFFKEGSSETCAGTSFCVEFDGNGNVRVFSYQQNGPNFAGFQLIHFWLEGEIDPGGDDVFGCTDREANNFNPDATVDDQSCQFDEPGGGGGQSGGGGGTTTLSVPPAGADPVLIPVTGADQLAELQLVLRSLGMAFVGASVLSGGLQRKIRR